jgi:hypothetical protein
MSIPDARWHEIHLRPSLFGLRELLRLLDGGHAFSFLAIYALNGDDSRKAPATLQFETSKEGVWPGWGAVLRLTDDPRSFRFTGVVGNSFYQPGLVGGMLILCMSPARADVQPTHVARLAGRE